MPSFFDILDKFLGIIFPLFLMCFGFYQASVIHKSYDAITLCWQIWGNVLMNCIYNSVYGTLLTLKSIILCCESLENNDNVPTGSVILIVTGIIQILVNIWTMVINDNIYDSCADRYKNDFPELWQVFNIQVIIFFISIAMIGFVIVFSIFRCCFECCEETQKNNNLKSNLSNSTPNLNFNTV